MRIGVPQKLGEIKGAWDQYQRDDGPLMSAAVAYYIGLSLFPMLLVLIAGTGLFLRHTSLGQNAEQQVMEAIAANFSPSLAAQVGDALGQVQNKSAIGGPVGLATMLVTMMAAFMQFERAFDRIWNVPQDNSSGLLNTVRRLVIQRSIAFLALLMLGAFVFLVFVLNVVLTWMRTTTTRFVEIPPVLWNVTQIVAAIGLNSLLFTLLYRWLPKVSVRWRDALQGAVLTSILWEIGRQILSAFLIGTKYSSAYGVVGSFIGVLVWCQYAMTNLFFGAEYVQQLGLRDRAPLRTADSSDATPLPEA